MNGRKVNQKTNQEDDSLRLGVYWLHLSQRMVWLEQLLSWFLYSFAGMSLPHHLQSTALRAHSFCLWFRSSAGSTFIPHSHSTFAEEIFSHEEEDHHQEKQRKVADVPACEIFPCVLSSLSCACIDCTLYIWSVRPFSWKACNEGSACEVLSPEPSSPVVGSIIQSTVKQLLREQQNILPVCTLDSSNCSSDRKHRVFPSSVLEPTDDWRRIVVNRSRTLSIYPSVRKVPVLAFYKTVSGWFCTQVKTPSQRIVLLLGSLVCRRSESVNSWNFWKDDRSWDTQEDCQSECSIHFVSFDSDEERFVLLFEGIVVSNHKSVSACANSACVIQREWRDRKKGEREGEEGDLIEPQSKLCLLL